jgi:hypothetical protein
MLRLNSQFSSTGLPWHSLIDTHKYVPIARSARPWVGRSSRKLPWFNLLALVASGTLRREAEVVCAAKLCSNSLNNLALTPFTHNTPFAPITPTTCQNRFLEPRQYRKELISLTSSRQHSLSTTGSRTLSSFKHKSDGASRRLSYTLAVFSLVVIPTRNDN